MCLERDTNSENTKKSSAFAVRLFRSYLREKCVSDEFEKYQKDELDLTLGKFYTEVRTEKGELYKKKSLQSIRHGINRYLSETNVELNIVQGSEFKKSQKLYSAACAELKRSGKGGIEHYEALEPEDMKKLYQYFDIYDNVKLQEKVFVDIMLYFGRRGRENLKNLKVNDFACTTDTSGSRYIYLVRDERTKNHQSDENTAQGHMYEIPDSDMCPVKSFLRYIRKLKPGCISLFQRPSKQPTDDKWYDEVPLGHNTISGMMPRLSEKARLSKRYTNHSLRATTVNILDNEKVPGRHIMTVTGHKSETSLKTYSGKTSETTKKMMSRHISSVTCPQSNNIQALVNKSPKVSSPKKPLLAQNSPLVASDEFGDVEFDALLQTFNDYDLDQNRCFNNHNIQGHNSSVNMVASHSNNSMNIGALFQGRIPVPLITNCGNVTINYNISQGSK